MGKRKTLTLDDLIRVPWYFSLALGALAYLALGVLAPLWFGSRDNQYLDGVAQALPFLAKLAVFICLAGAALSAVRQRLQGRLLDSQSGLDSIHQLTWQQFEELCAAYFRRQGYTVVETPPGPDGGVDLVLRKDGQLTYVQCKHWKQRRVGVQTIRELQGVVSTRDSAKGIVITSGEFTQDARNFANKTGIFLISGAELAAMAPAPSDRPVGEEIEPEVNGPPPCPRCHGQMIARRAQRGPNSGKRFWGCSAFPRCRGSVPLDR